MFEPVAARYDGPALEKVILDLWKREDVFKRVLDATKDRPRFVFYEGPPTANGRPGIHHVLARTFKDLYPRYKTMRGFYVPRKAGWDTHGLPVEHEVEKQLGIFDKKRIEKEVGIGEFVAKCRESVMRYIADWEAMTERMGYWVDMSEAYYTLHNEYIESVWWLLKRIWDRGLIYQGYKVVPYDPRIGATLSSHEVALGYKEVEDPSVYVRFRVVGEPDTSFLVWTTTPWTLPSNLALAVHPDVEYAWVRCGGETLIVAKELVESALGAGGAGATDAGGAGAGGAEAGGAEAGGAGAGGVGASGAGGEATVGARTADTSAARTADTGAAEAAGTGGADAAEAGARTGGSGAGAAGDGAPAGSSDVFEVIKTARGRDLDGMRYERLFDYLPADGDICRVRTADFVTIEDGTGIVHIAPAYGEDDLKVGQRHGLPVLHGVGDDGYFVPEVTPVAGKFFKDADPVIMDLLRERGLLFRAERYKHNYPFGWRTGDPLIYYAKHAWYIRTTEFRERLVELNREINWVPEYIRDGRFGNWLENNIDWALSRERFWGTPLPVWTDGEGDFLCIGSVGELEQRTGRKLDELDLHRPAIDEVTFMHEGREYRRVAEVIDCWFDSGSMPYAQWHYPFENESTFETSFPADFICEAIDQTRGWFYTLHAIATMVSDSVAYQNVICLSHIVDQDGKKMSKSLGNIIDPYDVFDSVGADAMRWHFTARVAPDMQKRVSVEIIGDVASGFVNTLWNTYAFFVMYARLDGVDVSRGVPVDERPEIDRWVISLLEDTIRTVTEALDRYDALEAGAAIEGFVDQLSNWYVRRNRRRFWKAVSGDDKQAAYATLYECLETLTRLLAPFVPFISEAMYQNLVRRARADAPVSVHLTAWPEHRAERLDKALLDETQTVQRVVGLGRAARNESRLKVRQPLARLLVRVPDDAAQRAVQRHAEQILEELNVKAIELLARDAELVSYRIKPNLPLLGKRYGKLIPAIREYLSSADTASMAAAAARGELQSAKIGGETVEFPPDALLIETSSAEGFACAEEGGYLVGLDTSLTEELKREGLARELVRAVQEARKQAGLEVADRIELHVEGDEAVSAALAQHRDYVMNETLASRWQRPADEHAFVVEQTEFAPRWVIRLAKAADEPAR